MILRRYRTDTGTPGILVKGIPVPGVCLSARTEPTEVYQYQGRTEVFFYKLQNAHTRSAHELPSLPQQAAATAE